MKYTIEIDIDLPRERVIELFDNPDNMQHWQPGFISFEHMEGTPGQVGAKSKINYNVKGRKFELIETITVKNLPDEFSGTFEAKGMFNKINNYFTEEGPNKTKWTSENEFIPKGFLKILAWLMPSSFKKSSMKYLTNFKEFAENAN